MFSRRYCDIGADSSVRLFAVQMPAFQWNINLLGTFLRAWGAMDRKRVATGLPGLDPLIEGGLLEGKSYLVTGDPGGGKSIFCVQFLLRGLEEGEKAVY
ncbi:MAG: RAD55 family ATPase, partial [Candidatus Binatia bacterium]